MSFLLRRGLSIIGLALIGSCGQQKFPDYGPEPPVYENFQGHYRAQFRSLNSHLVGKTSGHSVLFAKGNQFYVRILLNNHIPHAHHHQYIHKGAKCPNGRADTNRDGVIDMKEIIAHSGKAIMPLDRALSSRAEGFPKFPSTNEEGEYYYVQSTSIWKMLQDLRGFPDSPNENFCRLEYLEEIDLEERTIIVYGNGEDETLPIACAEIDVDPNPEMEF